MTIFSSHPQRKMNDKLSPVIRFTFEYTFDGKNYLEIHGKTDEPMCWITFGFAWGLFEGALDRDIIGVEKNCVTKGDNHCTFEFRLE